MASTSASSPGAAEGQSPPRARRMWVLLVIVVVAVAAALGAGYYFLSTSAPANRAPVAVIHSSKANPVTYDTVGFNASASSDPDGDALTYLWHLPNASTSVRVALNYTFGSTIGTFPFTLTVKDSRGAQDVAYLNVTVGPTPLTVGTNPPYPPFEFYNGTSLEGFDIDLVNALAAYAGYGPTWTDFPDFSVLLQTVAAGGVDMAASAITSSGSVGAVRNTTMYFSAPYYEVRFGVLVRAASNLTCAGFNCTPADLANLTIGVQSGTSEEMWVQNQLVATNLTPSSKVLAYPSIDSAVSALQAGDVEVVLLESFAAQSVAGASGGNLRVAGIVDTGEQYSFAFPRTAEGLVLKTRIDAALQAAMQSGLYFNLYAKWFAV